ncbi:MAG TPA: type II secretion system F family protein [Acidimicrobiales bacterium]|nr:type II secretion system F family protein [Acidimicrobiales bacterium]
MTAVVLTALGSALGMIGIALAVRPTAQSLRSSLAELEGAPRRLGRQAQEAGGPSVRRLIRKVARRLSGVVYDQERLRSHLWPLFAITATPVEEFFGEVVLASLAGVALPAAWWILVGLAGVHVPVEAPLCASLLLGAGGAILPAVLLKAKADRAHLSARRAIESFVNLVVLCLAGGMGIESALFASARIGEGKICEDILNALVLAQDTGEAPWNALDHLGRDFGLAELTELAAAVVLAGTEGARIRSTLSAKSSSIRRHNLADAESEANAVTERLFLPSVCLLVGFLSFIAYPAVARISAGL